MKFYLSALLAVFSCYAAIHAQRPELVVQTGHSLFVFSVAFSPDGKTLASGSADNTIRLWDVASGAELRALTGHSNQVHSVRFSPDGRTLASGSWDGTIRLWDVASGAELRALTGHQASYATKDCLWWRIILRQLSRPIDTGLLFRFRPRRALSAGKLEVLNSAGPGVFPLGY